MMVIKRYLLPILFALILSVASIGFNTTPTHAMSSVIFAGSSTAVVNGNVTRYNSVAGGSTTWGAATGQSQVVSTTGKIKNLYVELSGAAGTGADDTYTFTLMYDGSASALTCAIVQGATSASDTTHEIDVVAGKLIIFRCVSSGSPDLTPTAQWSMMFSGTTANESLILGLGGPGSIATLYFPISQGQSVSTVAELSSRQICPTAGTIKYLYLDSTSATGTSWAITVNKNSVATALTAVVNCNGTSNNTTASFTVVAGDTLSMTSVPTSVTTAGIMRCGMTFLANTDGESIILGGSSQNTDNVTTVYSTLSTNSIAAAWGAESLAQHLGQVCQLKNLYVYCATAPGVGKTFDFTVESNTATATSITCQTTGAAAPATANDTIHTATLANMDNIALKCVPTGAPTVGQVKWGLVCYMYPAITNAPDNWTINGITGNSRIEPNTTYYSNPLGDTVAPSATVVDGECRFTITNSSTTPIDLTVNFPSMSGGDASANSDNGTNNGTHFGAYSYFSGKALADKVIAKSSGSSIAYSNLPSLTNILWGLEYISQTNAWTSGSAMSCNVTISATAH